LITLGLLWFTFVWVLLDFFFSFFIRFAWLFNKTHGLLHFRWSLSVSFLFLLLLCLFFLLLKVFLELLFQSFIFLILLTDEVIFCLGYDIFLEFSLLVVFDCRCYLIGTFNRILYFHLLLKILLHFVLLALFFKSFVQVLPRQNIFAMLFIIFSIILDNFLFVKINNVLRRFSYCSDFTIILFLLSFCFQFIQVFFFFFLQLVVWNGELIFWIRKWMRFN
jgi:hypothetical protein